MSESDASMGSTHSALLRFWIRHGFDWDLIEPDNAPAISFEDSIMETLIQFERSFGWSPQYLLDADDPMPGDFSTAEHIMFAGIRRRTALLHMARDRSRVVALPSSLSMVSTKICEFAAVSLEDIVVAKLQLALCSTHQG